MTTSFSAFLEKNLVRDLVKAKESNKIIYLDENSSVHDALQVSLTTKTILHSYINLTKKFAGSFT